MESAAVGESVPVAALAECPRCGGTPERVPIGEWRTGERAYHIRGRRFGPVRCGACGHWWHELDVERGVAEDQRPSAFGWAVELLPFAVVIATFLAALIGTTLVLEWTR